MENRNMDKEHKAVLEDNFLKHIGYEYVDLLCDEMEAEKESWENIEVPESLDQWIKNYSKMEEKRRKQKSSTNLVRFLKKASIIILAIVGINYFLIANVNAYRIQFLNSITYIKQKFTQVDYDKDDSAYNANIPKDFSGWYYMTYWPKGYTLSESKANRQFARICFQNETENRIILEESLNTAAQQLDSEDGTGTGLEINGQKALLVEKDNFRSLSWIQDDIAFMLQADDLPVKEMIKIAENIKKQE